MAIRMRNNKKLDSVCCECGETRKQVLDMFDICVGGNIFTVCDVCNEILFNKTLHAECYKNGRTKTPEDLAIIRRRANGSYRAKYILQNEEKKLKGDNNVD